MFTGARRASRPPVVLTLLLIGALAGCIGDDAPTNEDVQPGVGAIGGNDAAAPGKSAPISDAPPLLDGPSYAVGDAWTYEIAGALYPLAFTGTYGIRSTDGATYEFGTDAEAALKAYAHLGDDPLLAGLDKATFDGSATGARDLVGMGRDDGDAWQLTLYGTRFTVQRATVHDIRHDAGPGGAGIRITGTANNGDLLIEYADDVQGISRLTWAADETTQADWRLAGRSTEATGLVHWDLLDSHQGEATTLLSNMAVESWDSDGAGDKVFLRVIIDSALVARATVLDPAGKIVAEAEGSGSKQIVKDYVVADKSGTWNMVMSTTSGLDVLSLLGSSEKGRVDVYLYQIKALG